MSTYETSTEGEPCPDSVPTEPWLQSEADSGRVRSVVDDYLSIDSERSLVLADEGPDYRVEIARVCDELKELLLAKNAAYGNSAFEPINVFSQLPAIDGILVRIDDKLKRIRNRTGYPGDNDVKDLAGYLILLIVLTELGND